MASFKQKLCGSLGLFGILLGALTIGLFPFLYDAILQSVSNLQYKNVRVKELSQWFLTFLALWTLKSVYGYSTFVIFENPHRPKVKTLHRHDISWKLK